MATTKRTPTDFRHNAARRTHAQVHRFGDSVAAWLGTGEVAYIQPKSARAFARALIDCAREIERTKFADGNFRTRELKFGEFGELLKSGKESR